MSKVTSRALIVGVVIVAILAGAIAWIVSRSGTAPVQDSQATAPEAQAPAPAEEPAASATAPATPAAPAEPAAATDPAKPADAPAADPAAPADQAAAAPAEPAATTDPAKPADAPAAADPAAPVDPAAPGAVTETNVDPSQQVVARINGADITRQEVIESASDLPEQIRQQIDMVFPQLLNRYVGLKLLGDKGKADNLSQDPEVQKLMSEYETQAIRQVYVTRYLNEHVTEDAIKARYEQKLKDNPPPEEVRAAHILVKTEEEAKAIIEQLKGGADFAAVAKEKSTDKGSGANGGELGWFSKDVMVKEFADAAFAMKVDEISQAPVQSQFGFHIIKLEERRTQPAPTLDSQKEQIRAELSEETVQALVKTLRTDAKVELLGPDGKPLPEEPAQPAQPEQPAAQ